MNTTQANTTLESSLTPELSPIPVTGSWFGRYGMAPYTLIGLYAPSPVSPDEVTERSVDAA